MSAAFMSGPVQQPNSFASPQQQRHIDGQDGWSGDDSGHDGDEGSDKKRKRPMSVSCELCKQRKVKCTQSSIIGTCYHCS